MQHSGCTHPGNLPLTVRQSSVDVPSHHESPGSKRTPDYCHQPESSQGILVFSCFVYEHSTTIITLKIKLILSSTLQFGKKFLHLNTAYKNYFSLCVCVCVYFPFARHCLIWIKLYEFRDSSKMLLNYAVRNK